MFTAPFVSASTSSFQVGDLVKNFNAICVVDGFNHGDLILKIVSCKVGDVYQGGAGQRFCAPEKNCRLVVASDNVQLTHFSK